jgi:hypothetical protein
MRTKAREPLLISSAVEERREEKKRLGESEKVTD